MENTEKKTTEEPKSQNLAENLSEAELDKVAGAGYTPPKAGQIDKGYKDWGK